MSLPAVQVVKLDHRRTLGSAGERLAAHALEQRGYRILARNLRLPPGELDLVAEHEGCLVLVEVRLRRGAGPGAALESIGEAKQRRLRRLAGAYCLTLAAPPECLRIDVVGITLDRGGRLLSLQVIQNAVEGE